ncbi:MAG: hypothetical protein KDE27_17415 [Planctomycetes bacterium]|nr:hypothetical protein [Planctomycetota bacterium]
MAQVFAGPLSRWYHGEQPGSELARLRTGVETWRDDLRASVPAKIAAQLEWDEGASHCVAHELGDAGWMALRLFAFYAERTDLDMPDTVPSLLELDAAWRAASDDRFGRSLYGHLLACRAWLPGDFPVTLRVPMPDGETWEVGSVTVLANQLKWLNDRTFGAATAEVERWGTLAAPAGGGLLDAARRGYAGLAAAVAAGAGEGLPVVVREL